MPIRDEWKNRVSSNPRANIWWLNYQCDKVWENLPPEVVNNFEEKLNSLLEQYPSDTAPDEIIENTVSSEPDTFELKASRTPKSAGPYSRIVDVETFAQHYVSPKWPDGKGLEDIEKKANEAWSKFSSIKPKDYSNRKLRGTRPNFFFVTKTHSLENMKERCEHEDEELICAHRNVTATRVRNRLGLYAVQAKKRLVSIDIPEGIVPEEKVFAPTTLDVSTGHLAFAPSNDRTNNVGWTIDLEALANCASEVRGVEELLIKSIPLTKEMEVRRIGVVNDALPEVKLTVFERLASERANHGGGLSS